MNNSIQQFIEKNIKEVCGAVGKLINGELDGSELSEVIHEQVLDLGRNLLVEIFELIDEEIRKSISRKKSWRIEHRNEAKEILDVMGNIRYSRTGYENKKTGEYVYLLDQVIGIDPHQRITLGAAARTLEEAVMSSYARGGKRASVTDIASKETVKKLVHGLEVEMPVIELKEKRKIKHLHIVADEDHVAAQFWEKKGDLKIGENGHKINTIQPKLICVYEDIVSESGPKCKKPRHKLIHKQYFSGVYAGTVENEKFWRQVADYINKTYDTEVLEKVYISGDGASWIKTGCDVIENGYFVLDKFHMAKYINKSIVHLGDDGEEIKAEIWRSISRADKKGLIKIYKGILGKTVDEKKKEEVLKALKYLTNNWSGIKIQVEDAGAYWGCCAEGQVSHLLSDRLSSRPMGWSILGCDQMAKLRAFRWNGGKVIDLLKYQKEKRIKEEQRIEQEELRKELKNRNNGWAYEECMRASIPGLERAEMGWLRDLINQRLG